jgi:hypothetical protein
VLTIPDNFADLYHLPMPVLNAIRSTIADHLPAQLEAPSKVSLFVYDNDTLVVHNFRDEQVSAGLVVPPGVERLTDVRTGERLTVQDRRGGQGNTSRVVARAASFTLPPHSFRALRMERSPVRQGQRNAQITAPASSRNGTT